MKTDASPPINPHAANESANETVASTSARTDAVVVLIVRTAGDGGCTVADMPMPDLPQSSKDVSSPATGLDFSGRLLWSRRNVCYPLVA